MATVRVQDAPELVGRKIGGHEIVIVRSDISGEWVIAQKDQPYNKDGYPLYMSYRDDWGTWPHSRAFAGLEKALKWAINASEPPEGPIPYDEIDQSEDDNPENYPLFQAPEFG